MIPCGEAWKECPDRQPPLQLELVGCKTQVAESFPRPHPCRSLKMSSSCILPNAPEAVLCLQCSGFFRDVRQIDNYAPGGKTRVAHCDPDRNLQGFGLASSRWLRGRVRTEWLRHRSRVLTRRGSCGAEKKGATRRVGGLCVELAAAATATRRESSCAVSDPRRPCAQRVDSPAPTLAREPRPRPSPSACC